MEVSSTIKYTGLSDDTRDDGISDETSLVLTVSPEDIFPIREKATRDEGLSKAEWVTTFSILTGGLKASLRSVVSSRILWALMDFGKALLRAYPDKRVQKALAGWRTRKRGRGRRPVPKEVVEEIAKTLLEMMITADLMDDKTRRQKTIPHQKGIVEAALYQALLMGETIVYPGNDEELDSPASTEFRVGDVRLIISTARDGTILGGTIFEGPWRREGPYTSFVLDVLTLRDMIDLVNSSSTIRSLLDAELPDEIKPLIEEGRVGWVGKGDFCQFTHYGEETDPHRVILEIAPAPLWSMGRTKTVFHFDGEKWEDLKSVVNRIVHSPLYREGMAKAEKFVGVI